MRETFVLAHFIELENVPREFNKKEWPLHITLVGNFCINQSIDALIQTLSDFSEQQSIFDVSIGEDELFGPDLDVPVSLVVVKDELIALHTGLLDNLANLGVEYETPNFVGEGYRPHATIQRKSRLIKGQGVTIDSMTIVNMSSGGDNTRKIVETYPFIS